MAKSTFDSRMPQIEGVSGSIVVVWIYVVLELGLTESRTFVWVVIRAGGGYQWSTVWTFVVAIDIGFCRWENHDGLLLLLLLIQCNVAADGTLWIWC
jgi:hypothetical protein